MINISKPYLGKEEKAAVMEVLDSGMIVQGPKTRLFEESFAKKYGVKHAIALNSGTAAIHTALFSYGIGEGDEVITTPFSFIATVNPIIKQGAKPVFVDISEDDFNIDPEKIEEKITGKTKAIIAVNLFGQTPDMDKIRGICKRHNIILIEDACQSVGVKFKDTFSGALGDSACFSLYATKNMMCGEGGILTTNNDAVAEIARRFRAHGENPDKKYAYYHLGYNYRMTDMAAAIALEQLKRVESFNSQRLKNAEMLTQGLKGIHGLILPKILPDRTHVFHQYSIRITPEFRTDRKDFIDYLLKNNIQTAIYYPKPLHLFDHISKLGYKKGDFPIAEKISEEILSLPVHPQLSTEDIMHIIKTIKELSQKGGQHES